MSNLFENNTNSWNSVYTMPQLDLGSLSGSGKGFWGGLGDIAGKYGPQLISGLAGGFGGSNSQLMGPKQIADLTAITGGMNAYDWGNAQGMQIPIARAFGALNTEFNFRDISNQMKLGPVMNYSALAKNQYDRNTGSKNYQASNVPSGPSGLSLAEMSTNPGNTFDIAKTNAYQNTDPLFAQTVAFTGLGARRA